MRKPGIKPKIIEKIIQIDNEKVFDDFHLNSLSIDELKFIFKLMGGNDDELKENR